MYDAQQEIVRILGFLHTRIDKMDQIKDELRKYWDLSRKGKQEEYDLKIIRRLYTDLVKLSARVKNAIR